MLRRIFTGIGFIIIVIGYGQVGRVTFTGARAVPKVLGYQGYLTDTLGSPIDDTLDMTFKIFGSPTSGPDLWSETQWDVPVERGVFSVLLGNVNPIPDTVLTQGTDRWLELTIEWGDTLQPRTRIVSAAYAYMSTYSDTAEYAKSAATDFDWVISDSNMYSGVAGNVGLGVSMPGEKCDVDGNIRASGQLISETTTSSPLVVAGTTLVTNLNADFVDGREGSNLTDKTGDETIAGNWSFTNPVTVGAPTAGGHAVRKTDLNPLVNQTQVGINTTSWILAKSFSVNGSDLINYTLDIFVMRNAPGNVEVRVTNGTTEVAIGTFAIASGFPQYTWITLDIMRPDNINSASVRVRRTTYNTDATTEVRDCAHVYLGYSYTNITEVRVYGNVNASMTSYSISTATLRKY